MAGMACVVAIAPLNAAEQSFSKGEGARAVLCVYLHWADDIMRLRRPLAHIFLHLVPLSTFAHEKEQSDSGGGDSAARCPWYDEPCFDEDTRNVLIG